MKEKNPIPLQQIRENERNSHIEMYTNQTLYGNDSWLQKPVKTVSDLIPYFADHTELRVLDLGCGIGRNCIPIAKHFQDVPCRIDCVDILEFAIEKLSENASTYGVTQSIHGIVKPIDEFLIPPNHYDWIIAVSALEHMDSETSLVMKLAEIRDGLRKNGIVCLIINTNITEFKKTDGCTVPAQFEVNLQTEVLQDILNRTFKGLDITKFTVRTQNYDITRDFGISELHTDVVTFVAQK